MEDTDIIGGLTALHDKLREDIAGRHLSYINNQDATAKLLLAAATRIDKLAREVDSWKAAISCLPYA